MNSYSKSVSSLSSARGWKTKDLLFMPNTQAESGELANIRPGGGRNLHPLIEKRTLTNLLCSCATSFVLFTQPCAHRVCSILSACQSATKQTWSPFWWQSSGQTELASHPNEICFLVFYFLDFHRNSTMRWTSSQRSGRFSYLLHVAEDVLPAVKHTLAFLCVQVENEVCAVVCVAFLISERDMKKFREVSRQR